MADCLLKLIGRVFSGLTTMPGTEGQGTAPARGHGPLSTGDTEDICVAVEQLSLGGQ